MVGGPGAWYLVIIDAAVLLVAVAVIAYVFRRRDTKGGDGAAAWDEAALDLVAEVRRIASTIEPPADPDRVSRRLLPLSARIRGHVREAPAAVDETAYRELFDLGVACQRVAVERRTREAMLDGAFLEDRLASLDDRAAKVEATLTGPG